MAIDRESQTAAAAELFHRKCEVSDSTGAITPLVVTFYAPLKNPDGDDYVAKANISCAFFDHYVYGVGEDAAQAFLWLPVVVAGYLIGQRRYGYEAYWLEKGDLDYQDFWLYRR